MVCPYCGIGVKMEWVQADYVATDDGDDAYAIQWAPCPVCDEFIVNLKHSTGFNWGRGPGNSGTIDEDEVDLEVIIYPQTKMQYVLDASIPPKYGSVFREAEATLNISPRASATLSRYLLQLILHEHLGIHKRNLEDEIKELEKDSTMPTSFVRKLTLLRRIANFGAHPKKSTNSNEIIDVEPGEAETLLEVLLDFFDIVFVRPADDLKFEENVKTKYGISLD